MDPATAAFAGIGSLFLLWGVIALLTLLFTVFWIVELVDVARREFPDPTSKIVWIVVLLLSHVIGALVYYFIGKNQGTLPATRSTY